jgi:hypothetical protein
MLGLGFPERPRLSYLGDDLSGPEPRRFDVGDRVLCDAPLSFVEVEDRGAIAHAHVVALTVQRRRIVDLEEELEQVSIRGLLGVEDNLDRLGVRPWSRYVALGMSPPVYPTRVESTPGCFGSDPASPRNTHRQGLPSRRLRSRPHFSRKRESPEC